MPVKSCKFVFGIVGIFSLFFFLLNLFRIDIFKTDVRAQYERPCGAQGYKVIMPGNVNAGPASTQMVSMDGSPQSSANPYLISFTGLKTFSVSVPAGYRVGYTLCYNSTNCHTGTPTSGSSVVLNAANCPLGYADLWWHFDNCTTGSWTTGCGWSGNTWCPKNQSCTTNWVSGPAYNYSCVYYEKLTNTGTYCTATNLYYFSGSSYCNTDLSCPQPTTPPPSSPTPIPTTPPPTIPPPPPSSPTPLYWICTFGSCAMSLTRDASHPYDCGGGACLCSSVACVGSNDCNLQVGGSCTECNAGLCRVPAIPTNTPTPTNAPTLPPLPTNTPTSAPTPSLTPTVTPTPTCAPQPITCTPCSLECGGGTQTCNNYCTSWIQDCNTQPCPIDGVWCPWTSCNASCGTGTQSRICECPPPAYGGDYCAGSAIQECCVDPCAPAAPQLSSPANGRILSGGSTALTWQEVGDWGENCSGNDNTYTVYLDTNSYPTTPLCLVNEGTTSCGSGSLNASTRYYWRVVASNGALSASSSIWSFTTPFTVFGWTYTERNNNINRATAESEGLISGLTVNLGGDKTDTTTSLGSRIGGYLANYIFYDVGNGVYNISLPVTPTGYQLYPGYTNPQTAVLFAAPVDVDFPFVTSAPPPTPPIVIPTKTPSPTPWPTLTPSGPTVPPGSTITPGGPGVPPGSTITPRGPGIPGSTITPGGPGVPPGSTITPGNPVPTSGYYGPTPTFLPTPTSILSTPPANCASLPTPALTDPSHDICTNNKPDFSARVSDPNGDNAWARFYSNAYETFMGMGTPQVPPGGLSTWTPYATTLNQTGSYWWTAYTESSTCPRSIDAPARLVKMDYSPPPQPQKPSCTLVWQNLISGVCNFTCSWPEDPETDGSCSNTQDYRGIFWTSPTAGSYDTDWQPHQLSTTVFTEDGQALYSQLYARDGLGNISDPSATGGPFTCPKIIYSPSLTPRGPTYAPTITPTRTPSPTPTITLTPTPGAWMQVMGGNVYQKEINQPIPNGFYFLNPISPSAQNPQSSGVIWSNSGNGWFSGYPNRSSPDRWQAASTFANIYNFSYYAEALKDKAIPINNNIIGINYTSTDAIYSYSGLGYYTLPSSPLHFAPNPDTDVTIFIISGSLEIKEDMTPLSDKPVVFVVNGNIYIDGNVKNIYGLFISSQTFTISEGVDPVTINGMIYAKIFNTSPGRHYYSFTSSAYQIIYQPKYVVALLPYLGRTQVNWQEVGP